MDNSGYRQCLAGLVTINNSNTNSPYLSTAWIYPFYRRRGLLSKLWPKLQELYGSNFEIERPNEDMKAFLKGAKHADYQLMNQSVELGLVSTSRVRAPT